MSEVVLGGDGRAVIHNTETGEALSCSVPTALENVANGQGLWAHGEADLSVVRAPRAKVATPEPVIALSQDDVLPLPAADVPVALEPEPAIAAPDPLDHDGDGKKGGRKPTDPERSVLFAALEAKGIKAFKGSSTDKLKALLAG